MMLNYYKYLLDTRVGVQHADRAAVRSGRHDLLQPVRDGRPLVQQHPVDPGGNRERLLQERAVRRWSATGRSRAEARTARAETRSVSGVNKMLNTLLTAAGVTKTGGAPTDDFGDPSLPKGIFSEMHA